METPETTVHIHTPRQLNPRILAAAEHSGTLRHMIRLGTPLTREKWISMNYMGRPPHPWTAEHEEEVPEPFRKKQPY